MSKILISMLQNSEFNYSKIQTTNKYFIPRLCRLQPKQQPGGGMLTMNFVSVASMYMYNMPIYYTILLNTQNSPQKPAAFHSSAPK